MGTLEIVAGVLLILSGLVIILVVLAQESKEQGLTSAIGGGANESFYEHNMGKTRDARLSKFTRNAAIIMFIVTLVVNIVSTVNKNKDKKESTSESSSVVTVADTSEAPAESAAQ